MSDLITETHRGLNLAQLRDVLELQQARKLDMVIPASKLAFRDGQLVIAGQDMILNEEGFTDPNGTFRVTDKFQDDLADKLGIHVSYLRRLREGRTGDKGRVLSPPRIDLWDHNVNQLLHGRKGTLKASYDVTQLVENGGQGAPPEAWKRTPVPADDRSFFCRLFTSDAGDTGIARALLSDRFGRMDNLDALFAILDGITQAGIDPATLRMTGDITETRMYVEVVAPEIWTAAEDLLGGYRSPFDANRAGVERSGNAPTFEERVAMGRAYQERGRAAMPDGPDGHGGNHGYTQPGSEPILMAGFKIANSEVGNGRWTIVPTCKILKCWNGWTQQQDLMARSHIGAQQSEGHIAWSEDTQTKELAWVTAQTRDIVVKALSQDYLDSVVAQRTEQASKSLAEPEKTIQVLADRLKWTKAERDGIWQHFEMGGQYTAGGVANAVTSYSQTVDADKAWDLDAQAMRALELAAR